MTTSLMLKDLNLISRENEEKKSNQFELVLLLFSLHGCGLSAYNMNDNYTFSHLRAFEVL